jgi:hypothetical protein
VTAGERFYEQQGPDSRRSAPAVSRNRKPIAEVLREWLPAHGLVLEIASGTGEHAAHFSGLFPDLEWQPSDVHPEALQSIRSWRADAALPNLRDTIQLDASSSTWPIDRADAVLNINMVHISPWASALGLLDGASRLLAPDAPLILYGPWFSGEIETAPSNLAFDLELKQRNSDWGLRKVEDFAAEAKSRGFELVETRPMPANNLMLLFQKDTAVPQL